MIRNLVFAGTALLVALCASGIVDVRAQASADDPLTFEVASVKPSTGCPPKCGLVRPLPGNTTYHAEGATLRVLMTIAYTVTDRQIAGGPAWINSERFDIEAKAARPRTTDELHTMLQHLLEERFQLKVRHETRDESVYFLTVNKGGSKLPVHDVQDKDYPPMGGKLFPAADGTMCPGLSGRNVKMDYFAFTLSRQLDRKVLDRTGLPERYDVDVQYMPDGARFAAGGDGGGPKFGSDCGDIFAALPRQLGLRLESAKGPVDYLVIERAERPSDN